MPSLPVLRDSALGPFRSPRMIITVSGPHGTGKSTYAAHLSKELGLRHVSAGFLFRKLAKERHVSLKEFGWLALKDPAIDRRVDEETRKEAEKGDVVVDGQLAGWVLKDVADLCVYLTAPENVRMERIAKRDNITVEDAWRETLRRESLQRKRYMQHYRFHVEDRSIYHLLVDTSLFPKEDTAKVLLTAALAVKAAKRGKRSKKP